MGMNPQPNELIKRAADGRRWEAVSLEEVADALSPFLGGGGGGITEVEAQALVDAAIDALVNDAPGALDTLKEIADQLALDESAVSALTTTVAGKLAKSANLSDLTDAAAARVNLALGNVTNTSDANKPVSTATQAALDLKAKIAAITQFTTTQAATAYAIPAGAKLLRLRLAGNAGGAGSGRRGAAGELRSGGGGSSGGFYTEVDIPVADLAVSTLYVTIGALGTGGAAVTADNTNGNAGVAGGDNYVLTDNSNVRTFANTVANANGGSAGSGGSTGSAAGGTATSTSGGGRFVPGNGGLSNGSGGAVGTNGVNGAPPGGGGGAAISGADATQVHGAGGIPNGRAAIAVTTAGASGAQAPSLGPGQGGAGGGLGQAGGDGGRAAGAGGGGAALNGTNSGKGGDGGLGFVEIVAYF